MKLIIDKINITQEQIDMIEPYIENLSDILSANDIGVLQFELDQAILDNLTDDYETTDISRMLQKIYDEIYLQNE